MSKEIEEWRPIQGFEETYEVSDWGRVRSVDTEYIGRNQYGAEYKRMHKGRIKKIFKHFNTNYFFVTLKKNGKSHPKDIHRLVAETFIPNPENKPCVGHSDCDEKNNSVWNLYWCTHKENNNHPITKQRMSEGQHRYFDNGGQPSFKGKHHTEESKRKLSEAKKGRFSGDKNPMYGKRVEKNLKPCNQYTMDDEFVKRFNCAKDAAREVGCAPTNITACCRGRIKSIKGFNFKYAS